MSKQKFVVLGTKVPAFYKELVQAVAEREGMTVSRFINRILHCFLKYGDSSHQMDPTLQEAIGMFEDMIDWEKGSCITGTERKKVTRAAYLCGKKDLGFYFFKEMEKEGEFIVMVDVDSYPANVTYNVGEIFQAMVRDCFPKLARDLNTLGVLYQKDLYIDTIKELVRTAMEDSDNGDSEYIRSMFADNNWAENGRRVDMRKYVAHNNRNPLLDEVRRLVPLEDIKKHDNMEE